MRLFTVFSVAILVLGSTPLEVPGAECGNLQPCGCGDVIRQGHYMLPADLGPCPEDGLTVTGSAEVDCGDHHIHGSGKPPDGTYPKTVGILLRQANGAAVRNCQVSNFRTGIELRDTRASTVAGVTVFGNGDFQVHVGYGIHFNRSAGNTLRDSAIRGNADEGVHVGSDSNDNTLLSNRAFDNGREDFYVLSARGTQIKNNRLGGKVSAALYMKHATLSHVEANQIKDRPVVVRGSSSGNVFVDNVLEGGLIVRSYVDKTRVTMPTANLFRGGQISSAQACISLTDTTGNRIENVRIVPCRRIEARSASITVNSFVGVSMERIRLDISGGATLRLFSPVRLSVVDAHAAPIGGVEVTMRDRTGEVSESAQTGTEGSLELMVPTHLVNAATLVALSPVVVELEADGYEPLAATIHDPPPAQLRLTLEHHR